MITLREVKDRIADNPERWRTYLMDFVIDFRDRKDLRAVAEPFTLSDERVGGLLASTAESLCDELGSEPPGWLTQV
ncbi:MAG: hypothetical protein LC800_07995, partial [Acidobacteria bacterium]|nr:hypothetical protein [Acidobacteriota bacterium]